MKKLLLILALVLTQTLSRSQELLDSIFDKTVFWQVSSAASPVRIYLYGTAHPIFRDDINIADTIFGIIKKAPFVYFENIPGPQDDSLISLMNKPRLKKVLGIVGYNKLVALLKKYYPKILDDPLFNWRVPQYINAQILKNEFGPSLTTVDEILFEFALQQSKSIMGLDPLATRIMLGNLIPLDEQANSLYRLVDDCKKRLREFAFYTRAIAEKYNAGDLGYLFIRNNYVRVNDRSIGQTYTYRKIGMEELLDKRNKQWLKIIVEASKTDGAFFAFGAAHLPGRNGILNLLRQKGFTLTPVFLNLR